LRRRSTETQHIYSGVQKLWWIRRYVVNLCVTRLQWHAPRYLILTPVKTSRDSIQVYNPPKNLYLPRLTWDNQPLQQGGGATAPRHYRNAWRNAWRSPYTKAIVCTKWGAAWWEFLEDVHSFAFSCQYSRFLNQWGLPDGPTTPIQYPISFIPGVNKVKRFGSV